MEPEKPESFLPERSSLSEVEKRIAHCYVRVGGIRSRRSMKSFLDQLKHRKLQQPRPVLEALLRSEPFKLYARRLRAQARNYIRSSLKADAPKAVRDYFWAREKAKEDGDYKEVRQGAQDLFDRVGVVGKREAETTNRVLIVLRGRNFDAADLDKELPEISASEIVIENPEVTE